MGSRLRSVLWFVVVLAGCAAEASGTPTLKNAAGKSDGASFLATLTDNNEQVSVALRCDQAQGCTGNVRVEILSPTICEIIEDPRCGAGLIDPAQKELGFIVLRSESEGERVLPLNVETGDGEFFRTQASAAFTTKADETIRFDVFRHADAPDLEISISADWQPARPVDSGREELETYLASIEGLRFSEISTQYPGYRAYRITYSQPLDHEDSSNTRRFDQSFVLHHRERHAPMVLYTSGYELFVDDALAETTESMGANQVSTEQRFFGGSTPADADVGDWQFVNIAQAAADHHRIVEALKPFYDGSWLSTGHSKGGMTSVYHHRFYPEDVDATVAYVAPISFALPDPRYVSFLDQIGGDSGCRESLRALLKAILEYLPTVQSELEADARARGETFELVGGYRAAAERSLIAAEWGFWQAGTEWDCQMLPQGPLTEADAAQWADWYLAWTSGDSFRDTPIYAYHFQAATELGLQSFSTAYLEPLLEYPEHPDHHKFILPEGVTTAHDSSVMEDVQRWVQEEAHNIAFLYGEYDPWTGGAFDLAGSDESVFRVDVAKANHGAMIQMLEDNDRNRLLSAIEEWTGVRPAIDDGFVPGFVPRPPRLLHEGLRGPVLPSEMLSR